MNTEPIGFKEDADFQLKKNILLECIGTSDNLEFELIPGEVLSFMVFQAMDKYAEHRSKKIAVALQKMVEMYNNDRIAFVKKPDDYNIFEYAESVLKEAGLNP